MKTDEFAFFNQQLAAMLRDGIPLEGALKRLCQEMRAGVLREELLALEQSLSRGMPLAEALAPRQLPDLYKRLLVIGVKGNDLPGALTMLADYFQRQNQVWTRIRSMMTYPLIVLAVATLISILIAGVWVWYIGPSFKDVFAGMGVTMPAFTLFVFEILNSIWAFPLAIGLMTLAVVALFFVPACRDKIIWRLPAFNEAMVSRVSASIHLMLQQGTPPPEAIELAEKLETNPQVVADLQNWRQKLAGGTRKFSEVTAGSVVMPAMFGWLVSGAGENLAQGFKRAAEIYYARAVYRTEVALYTILPMASIFLGAVVISQAMLLIAMYLPLISMISNLSGDGGN